MNKQITSLSAGGIVLFLVIASSLGKFEVPPSSDQTVMHPVEAPAASKLPLPSAKPLISGKPYSIPDRAGQRERNSATAIQLTGAEADETATADGSMDLADSDGKQRVLAARRVSLEDVARLQELTMDSNPEVRTAALARYRDLETEHEVERNVERRPSESGRFVVEVLQNLVTESDSFAQGEALAYLGEFGGQGDPNVEAALRQMLQRPELSTDTLSRVGELLIDNYDLPLDQVKELVENSPSVQQLPETESNYVLKMLEKMNNGRSDRGPESTTTHQ